LASLFPLEMEAGTDAASAFVLLNSDIRSAAVASLSKRPRDLARARVYLGMAAAISSTVFRGLRPILFRAAPRHAHPAPPPRRQAPSRPHSTLCFAPHPTYQAFSHRLACHCIHTVTTCIRSNSFPASDLDCPFVLPCVIGFVASVPRCVWFD